MAVPLGFQPVNIASLVSKSIWNITDIQTPGCLNLVPRARAFGGSCRVWSFLFSCHGATFALIICFLEAFHLGLCNSNPQSLKPRINQPSDVADHVTLPTRSKVRIRKVKNVHPKYSGKVEKDFDQYFKPWI